MQNIIITETVVYGEFPQFLKGQKVRVGDTVADDLVKRGHAKYDQGEEAVTKEAKEAKEKREIKDKIKEKRIII